MVSNSRIWRDSNTVPSGDKIEFNQGTVPDNTTSINQTNITLTNAIAVNEKPKGQLDIIQDTGFSAVTYIITGFIVDPTNSQVPALVKQWMVEAKTTTSFPLGRFGIELDDFPSYDVHPNSNRGIILQDWNWIRDGETRGKSSFVATLRFNSNVTGLNSAGSFAWDVA